MLADLAYARSHVPDPELIAYLNDLALKGHGVVFARDPADPTTVWRFLISAFPDAVRRNGVYLAAASAALALGCAVAFAITYWHAASLYKLLPAQVVSAMGTPNFGASANDMAAPVMSSFVTTNNIRVSFLALSLGFTLGLGTLWVLWYNGLMVGGLAALALRAGNGLHFWALVLPHGVVELPAICISGAAGLIIGRALLLPGRFTRSASLRRQASTVFTLIGGAVCLLVVAGAIEGFYTPRHIASTLKLGTAAATFAMLVAYIRYGGRRARH